MQGAEANKQWGLLELCEAPAHLDSLMVARILVDLQKEQAPLRVAKLSSDQQGYGAFLLAAGQLGLHT